MTPWHGHPAGATVSSYGHTVPRLSESAAPKAALSPEMETGLCTNSVYLHSSLLLTEEESTGSKQS